MEENKNPVPDESLTPPINPFGSSPQEPKKRSRIAKLVLITSFLFWIPWIFIVVLGGYLSYQSSRGVSGTEYILMFFSPVIILNYLVGIIYLGLLLAFVRSKPPNQPSKRQKTASIIVIILLIFVPVLSTLWSTFTPNQIEQWNASQMLPDSEASKLIEDCKVSSIMVYDDSAQLIFVDLARSGKSDIDPDKAQQFKRELEKSKISCDKAKADAETLPITKNEWISVEQATLLLQQCKVSTFNYTASGLKGLGGIPTTPSTGILLLEEGNTYSHLFVYKDQESVLVPLARSLQKQCDRPQFHHDNTYD